MAHPLDQHITFAPLLSGSGYLEGHSFLSLLPPPGLSEAVEPVAHE